MSSVPPAVTLARHAMATRFEIVLHGDNPVSLRAAGEEALTEIERLEDRLSLYRSSSEIACVNARAAREWVRVSPMVFRLLEQARQLSDETDGAFDITIAPLVRCWGFMNGTGRMPTSEEVEAARALVGMNLVEFRSADHTIRFLRDGVMLDLGAIGKGFAIDQAVEILREAGVTSAIVHGGTSSVYAIGHPLEMEHWKIAIERPRENDADPQQLLAVVPLRDEALSVSAVWGKSFQSANKTFGHVIDPRLGNPVESALLASVALASTTETDALSTALLTLGPARIDTVGRLREAARALVLSRHADGLRVKTHKIDLIDGSGT